MHKSPFPPSVLRVTFVNRGIYVSEGTLLATLTNGYAITPATTPARRKQNEKYHKLHGVY